MAKSVRELLEQVARGGLTVDKALAQIQPMEHEVGSARIDTDRLRRRGTPEVVYGPGKSVDQIVEIAHGLIQTGQDVFVTRVTPDKAAAVCKRVPRMVHHTTAAALTVDVVKRRPLKGLVSVACAGTSDLPVAEEAALTCERMGVRVNRVFDVGVAGLHRLMKHLPALRKSQAVVVVAGMEGALPSVVAGLLPCPVIAVPTSVGYGAHLNGIAPLLAMLNSCASGVTVVNIDNGFGAGTAAAMISRMVTGKKA